MTLPEIQPPFPRIKDLYQELNYPKGSPNHIKIKTVTDTFFLNYRARDGRPAKDFTSLAMPERPSNDQVFTDMAMTFTGSNGLGHLFWPSDSNSIMFNGLRFSIASDTKIILYAMKRLFYRMALHKKDKKGAIGPANQDGDSYDFDSFIDYAARSDDEFRPCSASTRFAPIHHSSESQFIDPTQPDFPGGEIRPVNVDATSCSTVELTTATANNTMGPVGDDVAPSEVFGPQNRASATRSTRPRAEEDDGEEPSAKRVREQEASAQRCNTTYGKTRTEVHAIFEGTRCSSRAKVPRVHPDYMVSEERTDHILQEHEIMQAAEACDTESLQTMNAKQPEQTSKHADASQPTSEVISEPVAPMAPMHPPAPQPAERKQGTATLPPAKSRVRMSTVLKLCTRNGKMASRRTLPWEPRPNVPHMTLSQLEEQVSTELDLQKSCFTLKSLNLKLKTSSMYFENLVLRGSEEHFGGWKQDISQGMKTSIDGLASDEILPVTIEVEALVEDQETDLGTDGYKLCEWCP